MVIDSGLICLQVIKAYSYQLLYKWYRYSWIVSFCTVPIIPVHFFIDILSFVQARHSENARYKAMLSMQFPVIRNEVFAYVFLYK